MKRFKFTQTKLAALPANTADSKSTEAEYSDTVVVGLKLLVGKKGNKKFLYRYSYRGKKRSIAIGSFGAFTVDQASPKQARNEKLSELTFADFALSQYLPHAKINKRSANSDESKLRLYLIPAFGENSLSSMMPQSIQQYLNKLLLTLTPATANRHYSLLHRIFALAIQWRYLEKNPCANISKFQENNQRQRFLSNAEIRALFLAADQDENHFAAAYFKFLLLTGVRRSEGLAAKWEDIREVSGRRVWHIPHTKSGKNRHVILNPMAIDILEALPKVEGNPYVFPGKIKGQPINNPTEVFKRIKKRAGIEESFRLHDIRHTVASLIINNGGTLYDVQATLAHANSSMSERYAHLSNDRLQETSDNLSSVVAGAIGIE